MTPVTNKPPMPQAPGKGIKSFPTPVIDDVVITEIVNAWKGDYKALDYGVKWDESPHASMQGSHPDHKLVFQDPASADGEWVKRIWVNDRVNQDSYNYAIKYSGGSQSHPIYIRTYILPREGYVPVPDLTPDDVYPTALLVEEEVQRNEGELDSKYIKVVRVFETLQGPEISSLRYNERGDLEEVISQQVTPTTPPTADGLLVTQSQVIKDEVSKATKTTATVPSHSTLTSKEKKEGLLGETFITDNIVDPTTSPDALSTTVISSSVEQTSKTKARKRTVTSSGPTSLSKLNKDGKLLGDTKVTRSVVSPTTLPDAPSNSVLSSEVDQTDSGKAIKTNVVLNSTPTLKGSKQSQGLLGTTTTQETVVLAGSLADDLTLNIVSSQVDPIDSVRSRKITETSTGPTNLSSDSSKQGLLGRTKITETIVPSNSPTDPLSISVLSSEVISIDSAKSKKITVTSTGPTSLIGKNNKEGLLGNTISVETIVPSGSPIDSLSTSVIASEITPIDDFKSKKTTVTSTGPTSLSKTNKDGKLLGDTRVVRSVVTPTTLPDVPSISILSSEVDQTDSGKAIKTNVFLKSTPILKGSKQSQGLLGETTTKETVVPAGTLADSLTLKIVSSQVEPIDSVRSRKITETSTGPTSFNNTSYKAGLLGQTTIKEEIVLIGSGPDPLSLTVLSSEVTQIDSGKSKRTTVTSNGPNTLSGISYKAGLLGQTEIKEEIVPNGSGPDPLSFSVLSSEVTPIDSAKSKKITVASTSPTALTSDVLASTPLGLVKSKKIERIVPKGTLPTNSLTKIADDVNAIDSEKSKQDETTVDSWPILYGSDYDETLGLGFAWTKTIVATPLTTCDSYLKWDAQPIDEEKTLKKQYIDCQVQKTLDSYHNQINTSMPIKLPDTLQQVTAYFGLSYGAGDSNSTGNGSGSNWSWSTGTSKKNSASVKGDLYFKVKQGFSGSIPCVQHVFFLKTTSIGQSSILSKLNAKASGPFTSLALSKYQDWPAIRLTSENIIMIGGSMSETLATNQSRSASNQGGSSSSSNSKSIDVDVSVNSIVVPQTLHDDLPINIVQIGNTGNLSIPFSVNPNTLAATYPVKMPVGKYLYSSDVQLYKFGYSKVTAITIELTENYV